MPLCIFSSVCVFVYTLSHAQIFVTPWTADCEAPLGGFWARILEWAAISYSRTSSRPRDQTHVSCGSCIGRQILYHRASWEAHSIAKYR